jgi:hypothetical protein
MSAAKHEFPKVQIVRNYHPAVTARQLKQLRIVSSAQLFCSPNYIVTQSAKKVHDTRVEIFIGQ